MAIQKELKAVCYHLGAEIVLGHSTVRLTKQLGLNGELERAAKILDQYYMTGRYPDALPAGAPVDFFSSEQASEAVALAQLFIAYAQKALKP